MGDDIYQNMKDEQENATPIYNELKNGAEVVKVSSKPQPKVVAATVGAGLGAAISTIVIYIIEATTGITIPEEVKGSSVVVFTTAIAFLSGYIKKN